MGLGETAVEVVGVGDAVDGDGDPVVERRPGGRLVLGEAECEAGTRVGDDRRVGVDGADWESDGDDRRRIGECPLHVGPFGLE